MSWAPRKPKWAWRDFLTEEEAAEVRDLERKIMHAKHIIALAMPVLNPIRNRAIHRAKQAALSTLQPKDNRDA